MEPDKTPEDLVADYRAAAAELLAALGTPAEDQVTQRLSDAIVGLVLLKSADQLDQLGVHVLEPAAGVSGVVRWSSGPDDAALRDAIERRDGEAFRALLLARGHAEDEIEAVRELAWDRADEG